MPGDTADGPAPAQAGPAAPAGTAPGGGPGTLGPAAAGSPVGLPAAAADSRAPPAPAAEDVIAAEEAPALALPGSPGSEPRAAPAAGPSVPGPGGGGAVPGPLPDRAGPSGPPGTLEVALEGEDVGALRLSLAPAEGAMTVQMTAERPETLELLRRHADLLARDLREIGYAEVAFRFGGDGAPGGRGALPPGDRPRPAGPAEADRPPPALPALPGRAAGAAGLDLRI